MENTYFSIKEAARRLGVSQATLRNWERDGKIKPDYTPKGHRRYTEAMLKAVMK